MVLVRVLLPRSIVVVVIYDIAFNFISYPVEDPDGELLAYDVPLPCPKGTKR